jgi:hypothetical protein
MNMLAVPDANSYAVIPNSKFSLPGAFTIEFWAQSTSFVPYSGLLEQTNNGDTGAFSIGFTSGNAIAVSLRLDNGITTLVTSDIPNVQNWQHYAITLTPNDSIRIYINGILISAAKTSAKNLTPSNDSILIAHSELTGVTFTGNIDELRFWNVARSSSQILSTMNSTLVGNEPGLKAYYPFDDDPSLAQFHDFSGGKSEGKIISSAVLAASTSPVTKPLTGYMIASKEQSVIFPNLVCDSQAVAVVHIYNRGAEQVQIDPAAFQIGTIFSPTTTTFSLPADSLHTVAINISANPRVPGLYRDTLIIRSTTVCGGILRIPVEIRYDKIRIAFVDTVFKLQVNANHDLLPCDLPIIGATTLLRNIGSKSVTITSLNFPLPAGIVITSPATPFIIDSGKFQEITLNVQASAPSVINTKLIATAAECSQTAAITFEGKRIYPSFTIPAAVNFPSVHLPNVSVSFDTTIFLHNTGTATLSMNPALSLQGGPGFQLLSPKSGLALIQPDSVLPIKIRFTTSSECGIFETAIHVQDQINCGIDTLIPVAIAVLGPDVSAANPIYDFGASCDARDSTITIVNRSGRTVTIGKPTFSQDSIFSFVNASLPKTLAPGDSLTVTFRFSPREPGPQSVAAQFPLSPCGSSQLTLRGLLGVGNIALSDSSLDFGDGCDLAPSIRKITITNKAGRAVDITGAAFEGSQVFSITTPALPFALANNESKDITLEFHPQQLRTLAQSRVTLFDSGCFVTRFSLRGARDSGNIPSSFTEFGTVCPGTVGSVSITLANQGFGDVTISSIKWTRGGTFFAGQNMNGVVIGAGASRQFSFVFEPKDTGDYLDILQVLYGPCNDTAWLSVHGIGGPPASLSVTDSVLDFSTIKLGTTNSQCIILKNQSCIGLHIAADSVHGNPNSPFAVDPSSLPDTLTSADPLKLCFTFSPKKLGSYQSQDTIRIGNKIQIIKMSGSAGFDSIVFRPRTIDFGDVLIDSTDTMQLSISNKGTYPALLTMIIPPAADFNYLPPASQTVGGLSLTTNAITFSPKHSGLQESKIVFQWENHFDTIFLIARGIEPGLAFPTSLIDFGKVRVGHDSVISVEVHNTLDSKITISNSFVNGKFRVSLLGSAFVFPHDSNQYKITYVPDAETSDNGQLIIVTSVNGNDTLLLHGEGVEAHLHVDTNAIDFGNVGLGQTKPYGLKVSNTGGYPLAITGVNKILPVFDTVTGGVFLIPPDSEVTYKIDFTPQRAVTYFDSLIIAADAPEQRAAVSLKGKGVFAPLGIPEVTYSIPDEAARVGDILDLPISIAGKDLSLFDLDSFSVELSFDPTVVYFHDTITTDRSLSSGFAMKFERLAHDSIVRISGRGNDIIAAPGRLFTLHAEALLGPNDSTRIFIASSDPVNTADVLSSSGSFVVTDCGNYRGGIISKGQYSVSDIKPNPISTTGKIDYELGLPGYVRLDLFDALGRLHKTIISESQLQGKHSAIFSTEDIPSGEYVYVLKSLEYEARGKMIIAK